MASPSPGPQIPTEHHTYQTSDGSDHGLIKHSCPCINNDKSSKIDGNLPCHCHSKPLNKTTHHHNLINASSNHPHIHLHTPPPKLQSASTYKCHYQSDSENHGDIHENVPQNRKFEPDDRIEVSPPPPALPPRPPPRPRNDGHSTLSSRSRTIEPNPNTAGRIRKYVFWCCACGGLATILGALFLAVYFLLRSYTSTLAYFETIPTFVPATMLILTGICVLSLARRKNRYSYLIKVCGICCLVCALTCVLVTITTTVIHMNRLQTLRECVYTQRTRTCTCYSVLLEAHASTDEGMRFIFDSTPDCEVIHGALYSCLRAMFGLSVSGILVCIFSCMLVYQLLSHEKKKMYWEQLELRCRSMYQHGIGPASTRSSVRGPSVPTATYCSCCEECQYPPLNIGPQLYPWDTHHSLEHRFWTPGRVGNFYSPNPGEEGSQIPGQTHGRERNTGWNWRRLPWNRGNPNRDSIVTNPRDPTDHTYQSAVSSSDSQYGFGNQAGGESTQAASEPISESTGSYSMLDNRPIGGMYVWGPPPPYSNPNSPARHPFLSAPRYHHGHYHHPHAHTDHCQINQGNQMQPFQEQHLRRSRIQQHSNKDNYENTFETEVHQHQPNDQGESTDTSSCLEHNISHTLPVRKMKKRVDISSIKSVTHSSNNRTNVQNVFTSDENNPQQCNFLPRLQGVENAAFQNQEANSPHKIEATESEVYFADVSSCCNISVKNDGHDSSLYDEAVNNVQTKPRIFGTNQILQNFQENISSATVTEDEEYLAHRLGKRQMSTRSRLPFPLPNGEDVNVGNIPKDISQNSLCSSVQTESTDDATSPVSPAKCVNYFPENGTNIPQFLAPDAQYEIIQECTRSNLANTISSLSNFGQSYLPPKGLNLNHATNRKNLGSNISNLIQNLGGNPVGLLYCEAHVLEDEVQGQGCHSDGTIDSGWHSGSEKHEHNVDNNERT